MAEYGNVVWPGEIDIAPETLYDDSISLCVSEDSPVYEPKDAKE